jgi:hypothetical protein
MNSSITNNIRKRVNIIKKIALFFFILAFLIVGGVIGYYFFSTRNVTSPSTISGEKIEEEKKQRSPLYYYFQSREPAIFTIYEFNPDTPTEKKIIARLEDYFRVLDYAEKEEKLLLKSDNKLYLFDLKNKQLIELFGLEKEKYINDAIFSSDKKSLAYAVTIGTTISNVYRQKGEVWIYDLETNTHKKVFEIKELVVNGVLAVLKWNEKDNKLIVRETGSDVGLLWGNIYLIDTTREKSNYKEIVEELKLDDINYEKFLRGKPSPDGKNWLYIFCETPIWDLEEHQSLCDVGEEIRIYNFDKGTISSIYRNLNHPYDINRKKKRLIHSAVWQDNENIVFSIPDGIYKVNIQSKSMEEIYRFPETYKGHPPVIEFANKDFVVYDGYEMGGNYNILDINTKKVIRIIEKNFKVDGILGMIF